MVKKFKPREDKKVTIYFGNDNSICIIPSDKQAMQKFILLTRQIISWYDEEGNKLLKKPKSRVVRTKYGGKVRRRNRRQP